MKFDFHTVNVNGGKPIFKENQKAEVMIMTSKFVNIGKENFESNTRFGKISVKTNLE